MKFKKRMMIFIKQKKNEKTIDDLLKSKTYYYRYSHYDKELKHLEKSQRDSHDRISAIRNSVYYYVKTLQKDIIFVSFSDYARHHQVIVNFQCKRLYNHFENL